MSCTAARNELYAPSRAARASTLSSAWPPWPAGFVPKTPEQVLSPMPLVLVECAVGVFVVGERVRDFRYVADGLHDGLVSNRPVGRDVPSRNSDIPWIILWREKTGRMDPGLWSRPGILTRRGSCVPSPSLEWVHITDPSAKPLPYDDGGAPQGSAGAADDKENRPHQRKSKNLG